MLDDGDDLMIFAAGQVRPKHYQRRSGCPPATAPEHRKARVHLSPELELTIIGCALVAQIVLIAVALHLLRSRDR